MRIFVITKRMLIIALVVLLLIAAGAILWAVLARDAPTMSRLVEEQYVADILPGRRREVPVYSVARDDKRIALTIDAAWEDDKTPFILEELERQGIKATFYLCGVWVKEYPEHVREIAAAGHEIGNHSATHPHMAELSAEAITKDIEALEKELKKLTGARSATFRAPFGEYNDTVVTTVRSLGFEIVQWDVDTIDWRKERSAETILETVFSKLASGSIILCHNNGYQIKEYLPTLITRAKEQGYEFVTVSELLLGDGATVDVNGIQRPAS